MFHVYGDHTGDLALITVGTVDGQVYLFDLKHGGDIMFEGLLWRVLQSQQLLKACDLWTKSASCIIHV